MLWIDPDGLRANGAEFNDLGEQAAQTFEELREALAREGRCWGDDEPGKAFEQNYLPDAERGLDALQQLATALQTFGQQLSAAADSFEAQDALGGEIINNAAAPGTDNTPVSQLPDGQWAAAPLTNIAPAVDNTSTSLAPQRADTQPSQSVPNDQRTLSSPAADPATANPTAAPISSRQPGRANDAKPGADPGVTHRSPAPTTAPSTVTAAGPPAARNTAPANTFAPRTTQAPTSPRPLNPGTTAATPWQAGARPTISAAMDRRPPNTPWSNGSYGGAPPWLRPGGRAIEPGAADRAKTGNRRPTVTAPATTPWLARSAQECHPLVRDLVDRHRLTSAGFDAPGLDETVLREFVTAVDTVLTDYPVLELRRVTLDQLAPSEVVRAQRQRTDDARRPFAWSITLNRDLATEPRRIADIVSADMRSGSTVPGAAERPVYAMTLRELGAALDVSGNRLARRMAQRGLIAEYLHGNTDYRRTTLGAVVHGYKRWRDQLCGHSFDRGRFDPPKALAWAFTDVVANGPRATEPAEVLHGLVVDAARMMAAMRRDASAAGRSLGKVG
ncbi:hypothetical protein [Nocardia sp. NPDC049149]|uniref:hypothetical protein n=1 Tax=Nocardia sp. NPDC049149 TaxID=3364315 RepID=UPI003711473B